MPRPGTQEQQHLPVPKALSLAAIETGGLPMEEDVNHIRLRGIARWMVITMDRNGIPHPGGVFLNGRTMKEGRRLFVPNVDVWEES